MSRSDLESWAPPTRNLHVGPMLGDPVTVTVEGRRITGPVQGFGRMWQKRFRAPLVGSDAAPREAVQTWRSRFGEFWPPNARFYGPLTGIAPGEVALLASKQRGAPTLSTGVFVLYADEDGFTFATPEGHMFAGWITFGATTNDGSTVLCIDEIFRASDPLYELGMGIGHRFQERFWQETLRNLATELGAPRASVSTEVTCLDRRRQWSRAGNMRHNAALRSARHSLGRLVSRRSA